MSLLTFCAELTVPSNNIQLEVLLDQVIVHSSAVSTPISFEHIVDDDDCEHVLEIRMLGKTVDDTIIDSNGNIVNDVILNITKFMFDDISIDQIIFDQTVYQHDFNGTGVVTQDRFYGSMGCNGSVFLKFSTPVYTWLLEHM